MVTESLKEVEKKVKRHVSVQAGDGLKLSIDRSRQDKTGGDAAGNI